MQGLAQFEDNKPAKGGSAGRRQGRIELGLQPLMDVVMMLTMPLESFGKEWFAAVLQSYPPSVRDDPAPVLAATHQVLMIRPDVGTATLAAAVVQKHREIEGLVDELEAMPRSEEDELRRLREAQEDHAAATERLRASVAKTGAPHHAHLGER